ncbi:transposase [Sorangium cellulosum]|nr:transposase [Sorangium cellulosum]
MDLVDRVLLAVPVRQWVLSLPFEIRRLAAFRAKVATAMGRIFIEEIARIQEQAVATSGAQHGAVNFLRRFGGSLNWGLHHHAVVSDGVFSKSKLGQMSFRHPCPFRGGARGVWFEGYAIAQFAG